MRKEIIEKMQDEIIAISKGLNSNENKLFNEFINCEGDDGIKNKAVLMLRTLAGDRSRSVYMVSSILKNCGYQLEKKDLKDISYENYCNEIFNILVFKRRNIVENTIDRLVREFVIIDLKSNVVRPTKNQELIHTAYRTLNDKEITRDEYKFVRALIWRVDRDLEDLGKLFTEEQIKNLNKVKDIYYSYLDLLNLKQYRNAYESLIEHMESNKLFALALYYPLLFIKHGAHKQLKGEIDNIFKTLCTECKESVDTLNAKLVEELTTGEVKINGKGKNILLVTRYGLDNIDLEGYNITFMEPRFYTLLSKHNAYDFDRFDYIKHEKDLDIDIFRS